MPHLDVHYIMNLIEDDQIKLKKVLANKEIPEIAVLIDQLPDKYKIRAYLALPTSNASEVLLEISHHSRKYILKSLKNKYIVSVLENAESDDSVDILSKMPQHKATKVLKDLPKEKKEAIQPLMKHEEDTAGHLMQSELLSLPQNLSIKDATVKVKKELEELENVNYVYVTDNNNFLKGVVSITTLLTSPPAKKLSQIMKKDVVKLNPDLDVERVANIFKQEDLMSLPVVSKQGKLLGRVTVDDILDVMEEEATEDMFKMAGVHPDESLFDPMHRSMRKRLPWLMLNLVTAIFVALVIGLFEDTIAAFVLLAAFMPMVAGMGGNAGTQTLALVVRGLALNQIHNYNYRKIIYKEIILGMFNGFFLGIGMAILAIIWTQNLYLGLALIISMTINVFVAGLIGSSIPMLLKLFKIDPAVASSVFITAATDIVGFFVFLGTASLLINLMV